MFTIYGANKFRIRMNENDKFHFVIDLNYNADKFDDQKYTSTIKNKWTICFFFFRTSSRWKI